MPVVNGFWHFLNAIRFYSLYLPFVPSAVFFYCKLYLIFEYFRPVRLFRFINFDLTQYSIIFRRTIFIFLFHHHDETDFHLNNN